MFLPLRPDGSSGWGITRLHLGWRELAPQLSSRLDARIAKCSEDFIRARAWRRSVLPGCGDGYGRTWFWRTRLTKHGWRRVSIFESARFRLVDGKEDDGGTIDHGGKPGEHERPMPGVACSPVKFTYLIQKGRLPTRPTHSATPLPIFPQDTYRLPRNNSRLRKQAYLIKFSIEKTTLHFSVISS